MMKTLKTGDVCVNHNNECVCVCVCDTKDLILTQDRVDKKITTNNHTKISLENIDP